MQSYKLHFVIFLFTASNAAFSGQVHHPRDRGVNTDSANRFVEEYYRRVKNGVSIKQYRRYWRDEDLTFFDKTVERISVAQNTSRNLEYQRVLDLQRTIAQCEKNLHERTSIFGKTQRFARLNYKVRNSCLTNGRILKREIRLSWSRTQKTWLITSIKDKEVQS